MSPPDVSDYRLAPRLVARIAGACLVVLAVLVLAVTALVAGTGWTADLLVALLGAGVGGLIAFAWWLRSRAYVVRLGPDGYRMGLALGVGVRQARWVDVTEAVTASAHEAPVVVLRLRDGRSTTIPVAALAADREDFVRDLQAHLQRGHGLRRL